MNKDKSETRYRATGVIVREHKILVLRRIKKREHFYVLPGGWPEPCETVEQAVLREVREECSIEAHIDRYLFTIENFDRPHHFYLITEFTGAPQLGGEEKEKMNEQDQYYLEWKSKEELKQLDSLYPLSLKPKLMELEM